MSYKKTSSHTKQQICPSLLIVTLIVIIGLVNHPTIYASNDSSGEDTEKGPREKNNALLISTETPNMSAEKDFDKIRGYESYDPITDTWSVIEKFKEVEILEDDTQHHDEDYIYYSFWAYDPIKHQWERVDIRKYGYKHPSALDEDEAITKNPKKKFEFWKNLGLTLAAGGGATYYWNTINNLKLLVRNGQREYFLWAPGSTNITQGKAYQIRWFGLKLLKKHSLIHDNVVDSQESYDEAKGDISFRGIGFNIPITAALHYTFFKKLRVGAGTNLEVNYLKSLSPKGDDAARITEYELPEPWFYNWKFFGTVGYKVFQTGKHAVVVDTQLGIVWDYGENWNPLGQFIHVDFYGSLGAAHELKLNDFCKFFYRLSGQFKRFHNASDFTSVASDTPSTSSITLWQPAIHLEIGTIFNFGRDKDSEEEDEDTDEDGKKEDDTKEPGQLLKETKEALTKAEQAKQVKDKAATSRVRGLFKK